MASNRVEILSVDRGPPYTVRRNTASSWHIVARDGFSIIATCYDEKEAELLASSPGIHDDREDPEDPTAGSI